MVMFNMIVTIILALCSPFFIFASELSVKGQTFELLSNVRLSGLESSTNTRNTSSVTQCILLGLSDTLYLSVSYDTSNGACLIYQGTIRTPGYKLEYDSRYIYTDLDKGWTMVFRALHGIGQNVLDAWNNQGHNDMTSVTSSSFGCLSIDGRLPCNSHFRSWRLDDWKNIKEVKVALYTDAQSVFHIDFNASETTNRNEFFKISRVTNSSATDLISQSVNFDSVEGQTECVRRFYMNHWHNGCTNDIGWLRVNDNWSGYRCCPYENNGPLPVFAYTNKTSMAKWIDIGQVGYAQVLAVFIMYDMDL